MVAAAPRVAVAGVATAGLVQMAPSVTVLGQWSSLSRLGQVRWQADRPAPPAVALTFDDGPSPDATAALLDRLDALELRGTFFPIGAAVERHREVTAEVARRGHQVETHGHSHRHHLWSSPAAIAADLERAVAALVAVGVRPRWWRPPYGQISAGTLLAARQAGLELALWSAWGREWASPDAGTVARRVIRRLQPGAVVLLHDSDEFSPPGSALRAREALGPIAEHVHRHRLRSVTLAELCGDVGGTVVAGGGRYPKRWASAQ